MPDNVSYSLQKSSQNWQPALTTVCQQTQKLSTDQNIVIEKNLIITVFVSHNTLV